MNPVADESTERALAVLVLLSSTKSPDELANAIGIPPGYSWKKGDLRGEKDKYGGHKYSGVEFRSQLPRSMGIQAHLQDLLDRLASAETAIRALFEEPDDSEVVRLRLLLYIDTLSDSVGIDISSSQLRAICRLGAHLGLGIDFVEGSLE